jgi:1,4-alpha-glucan branching enzyme
MPDSFTGIIDQLERQKAAIKRALAALREVEGIAVPAPGAGTPAVRKAGRPPLARNRRSEGQKKRWAAKNAAAAAPAPEPVKPKRRISAEGMKRIIAATKKRWRLKRAAEKAALAKKTAPKQAAGKKAVVKAPVAKTAKKVAPVKKTVLKKAKKAAPAPELVQAAG